MFTSDINSNKKRFIKRFYLYLGISVFFAIFGVIYEIFSHNVFSAYMSFAFLFPLIGCAAPFLILSLIKNNVIPHALYVNIYCFGIITLTFGSILQGVLEIYGTTNSLIYIYWFAGIGFIILGLITGLKHIKSLKLNVNP